MLDFRSFFSMCIFSESGLQGILPVASRADVVSPVPRSVEFKKQQLEGKNFKDLNSH